MIGGVLFPILAVVLPVAKDVIGLDLSIKQLWAAPPAPAIAMAGPPIVPFCRPMLGSMSEDDLNKIELVRVTGNCQMIRALCLLLLLLAGCSGTASAPSGTASGTAGPHVTHQDGMESFCATHRGKGDCPP